MRRAILKKEKIFNLPETGFLRLSDVLKYIPVGKTTWWNGVKSGKYPKSIKLGKRITAWRAEDIRELITEMNNGGVNAKI